MKEKVLTSESQGPQQRILTVGSALAASITSVLDAVPGSPSGPVDLAKTLSIDKVLASRLLKAGSRQDPLAYLHLTPGPEPLRRFLRAARRKQVAPNLIQQAEQEVAAFEAMIRREAGDRSALDAILSGWLPEARAEFELRRKQAAFRAISQLKGVSVATNLATVLLHPSADGMHLDVVWVFGLFGLQRLRPGCTVKLASRRLTEANGPRLPQTLSGESVEDLNGLRLERFCSSPQTQLHVHAAGDTVHYTLADAGFGPRSATDVVLVETNFREMARELPAGSTRKRHVFAEVNLPSKLLVFDALLHEDAWPTREPALHLYDTSFEGVADVNNPAHNLNRLDLRESIQPLGRGMANVRTIDVPRYAELLSDVFGALGWDPEVFRAYRCRIDYPLHGSQVVMAWPPPVVPPSAGKATE